MCKKINLTEKKLYQISGELEELHFVVSDALNKMAEITYDRKGNIKEPEAIYIMGLIAQVRAYSENYDRKVRETLGIDTDKLRKALYNYKELLGITYQP